MSQKYLHWYFMVLVSFFFGFLGLDRFIMGHWAMGFIKLFTLGGLGILWLIDLILIMSHQEFAGVVWTNEGYA